MTQATIERAKVIRSKMPIIGAMEANIKKLLLAGVVKVFAEVLGYFGHFRM